jgi:hypothetical protein
LEKRVRAIKDKISAEPGCIAVQNTTNPSPWRCEDVWVVKIVDPDEEEEA